jgi:methionyl-tRNA formyltransferase
VRDWVALFSQTGSEIKRIADVLGYWPTRIYTNNFNEDQWAHNVPVELVTIMPPSAIHSGLRFTKDRQFVTLHGYLRIIPADVCEMHDIYNGHPAPIHIYPELKGKDPQERLWVDNAKYHAIGSVVHKVTAGVDEGEIVTTITEDNTCISKEELYNRLRDTSLNAWLDFLKDKVHEQK